MLPNSLRQNVCETINATLDSVDARTTGVKTALGTIRAIVDAVSQQAQGVKGVKNGYELIADTINHHLSELVRGEDEEVAIEARKIQATLSSVLEAVNPEKTHRIAVRRLSIDSGDEVEFCYSPERSKRGAEGEVQFGLTYKLSDGSGSEEELVCKSPRSPAAKREIEREASFLSTIPPHDNIVTMVATATDEDGTSHILLKKADGSLNNATLLRGLSLEQKIHLAKGILAGVLHMHANKYCHSDINLKNILFEKGNALLTDFGNVKDFRTASVIPLDIPEDIQLMLDAGLITRDQIPTSMSLAEGVAMDVKATVTSVFNIFVEAVDEAIPADPRAALLSKYPTLEHTPLLEELTQLGIAARGDTATADAQLARLAEILESRTG